MVAARGLQHNPESVDTPTSCQPSWAPPNSGSPSTTTSSLRASSGLMGPRSMSRRKALVRTLLPASRHTLAAAFSSGNPLRPNLPTTAHADRWWPRTLRGPHRQVRVVRGRGRRRRRSSSTERLGLQPAHSVPWSADARR